MGVLKEYRQMPVAIEWVGDRKARVRASLQTENAPLRAFAFSDPRLSNPSQDAEEVLSGFLKITQRAMVKRRSWMNIQLYVPVSTHLSYTTETSSLSTIKCERYIFLYRSVFHSFIEVRKLFDHVSACICMWLYNIGKHVNLIFQTIFFFLFSVQTLLDASFKRATK